MARAPKAPSRKAPRVEAGDDILVSAQDALEFEPEVKRKRGAPASVWMFLLLVLVTGAGLAGFLFGGKLTEGALQEDSVPIVRADVKPIKVRPKNPGGRQIPDRDKSVYNRLQGEGAPIRVEKLLPEPEAPIAPPQAVAPQPVQQQSETPVPARRVSAAPPPPPVPDQTPAPVVAEKVAETPPAAVAPPTPPAPPPEPAAPLRLAPGAAPAVPVKVIPAPSKQTSASTQVPSVIKRVTVRPPSAWQVQLAASRSAEAARAEGLRMRKKFAGVLGDLNLNIVRVDLGERGVFHRIRLGGLADKASARRVCDQLKRQKQGCLVVAPGK